MEHELERSLELESLRRVVGLGLRIVDANLLADRENIRIVDNLFDRAGVKATGARNLTITGNRSTSGSVPIVLDPSCTEIKVENP